MNDDVTTLDPVVQAIAAIVLPLVIAAINSVRWSKPTKALVAALAILAVGVVLGLATGLRDGQELLVAAAELYVWAQVVYAALLRPLGLTDAIERTIWPRNN